MLFAGAMLIITALILGPTLNTIFGVVIFIFALGYLINPALVYNEHELKVKNIWGKTTKTYPFDDITLLEGELHAGGKRLKLYRTIMDQSEFQALIDHICDRAERIKRRSTNKMDDRHDAPGLYHNDVLRAMRLMDPTKIRQN